MNNTGVVPIPGSTATFQGSGDVTDAHLNATLTYVPEPSSALLLAIGSTLLLARKRMLKM